MSHEVMLISGRTLMQGISANRGKLTNTYQVITATLDLHPADAEAAGISDGDSVIVEGPAGQIKATCQVVKPDQLTPGMAFMPYGPLTSQLMDSQTQGTGMPDAKNFTVRLSPDTEGTA